ncbi:MAG: glycosyltransferase family 2 protein [Clostridia bacterium]|nr:glycosyltransferase family 2 protein [Clostridia bacterium]
MDVSIIMINYNTFDLTSQTIEGLKKFTKDIDYEIILIDNDSPDKSGEKLKDKYKNDIIFIQAEENLGTSKAVNRGVSVAKGKYILWLNTDVIFFDNFIKKLFDYMESNSNCGVCGGNLLDSDKNPMHSFRDRMLDYKMLKRDKSILDRAVRKIFKKPFYDQYNYSNEPIEVGYVTGADMMVRREIFDKIGGFDEDIFMYAEETEFQYRVKKLTKYKIFCVPDAKLIHLEGGSFNRKAFNERRQRVSTVGIAIFLSKCYGQKTARKFLEMIKKSYKRFAFYCAVCFKKNKKQEFDKKREITQELLNNFDKMFVFNN